MMLLSDPCWLKNLMKVFKEHIVLFILQILLLLFLTILVLYNSLNSKVLTPSIDTWQSRYIEYKVDTDGVGGWSVTEGTLPEELWDREESDEIELIYGPFMHLERGIYTLSIDYSCDDEQGYRIYSYQNEKNIFYIDVGDIKLNPNEQHLRKHFVIAKPIDNFEIRVAYDGIGDISVNNISVAHSSYILKVILLTLLAVFLLWDAILSYSLIVNDNQNTISYSNVFFIIIIIAFALFQIAFYNMMIYTGDNPDHLDFVEAILNRNVQGGYMIHMTVYPLYHITTRLISFFCINDIYVAGICVLTISNIAAVLMMRYILNTICENTNTWKKFLIDFISAFYLFFETFAGPLTDWRIYQRQCGPNPWHNPTITFVRPIGLAALCFFIRYIDAVETKGLDNKKALLAFSVLSVLSVLAKPSFMMAFLPAMGIYVLLYWVKDFRGRFPIAMHLLLAVIPTIAIILFQFLFCQFYNNGTVSPVKIQLGGFSEFTLVEIIKVCIATFPIPVIGFVLYGKELFEATYTKISYMALVFGVLEMFLFTNGASGDFSWGYDLAVGVSTMTVLGLSLDINDKAWRRFPLFAVFACQSIIGIYYVLTIFNTGGRYWI